jgi:hypothetical protein
MMGLPGGTGDNYWDEPDFVLTYIVAALVNGIGMEIGVTLMVRGLVVSGTLVSEETYLASLTKTLQQQVGFTAGNIPKDAEAALKDVLDMRSMTEFDPEDVFEGATDDDQDDQMLEMSEGVPAPVQHLHLRDPMVIVGEPPLAFGEGGDLIIRLRLTTVDGWMIGQLLSDAPDFPDFGGSELTH